MVFVRLVNGSEHPEWHLVCMIPGYRCDHTKGQWLPTITGILLPANIRTFNEFTRQSLSIRVYHYIRLRDDPEPADCGYRL